MKQQNTPAFLARRLGVFLVFSLVATSIALWILWWNNTDYVSQVTTPEQEESSSPAIDLHRDTVALLFESVSWFILVGKWTPELFGIIGVSVQVH